MEAKKPVFKNTVWVCEREMFVADAGTMTQTFTLKLLPRNECILVSSWYMPAYPAMYVNEDGSIDMHPATSSEFSSNGTWKYSGGKLTVTFEDELEYVFELKDDTLVSHQFYGIEGTFVKQ
ncbi:MAG: lipocalin family protein [Bacteroidales bacterium]|nr:lipocalin family protein [Bacteroidales bacterium]